MSLVINTNIASLNSQRQLMNSGASLDRATERLSSGQRINSAKDDAAGLAISNRMTSQIRGLGQAIRNANDGVSLIQTAEGALQEITNIFQRMRELSIQSANGIYSNGDRQTLNAEVQQLISEVDRIADTTSFNGQNILDGSLGEIALQVGSQANQTMEFSIDGFNTNSLGGTGGDLIGEATTGIGALSAFNFDGTDGLALFVNDVAISDLSAGTTLNDKLSLINADLDGKGAQATILVTQEATNGGSGQLVAGTDTMIIVVSDGNTNDQTFTISDTSNMDELIDKINAETSVSASLSDAGKLILSQEGVGIITVSGTGTGLVAATASSATGYVETAGGESVANFSLVFNDTSADQSGLKIEATFNGTSVVGDLNTAVDNLGIDLHDDDGNLQGAIVTVSSALNDGGLILNGIEVGAIAGNATIGTQQQNVINAINKVSDQTGVVAFVGDTTSAIGLKSTTGSEISIATGEGTTAAELAAATGLQERNASGSSGSVATIDISTAPGAQRAIDVIDKALEQINSTRAEMGAINNRLDFTVSNLSNVSEKTSAARSRIMDTDFAQETASLSRAQVLQQAATAMLAQANARPQQVLSLLQ